MSEESSWWDRNRRKVIVIGCLGCSGMVLLSVGAAAGCVGLVLRMMKSSGAYQIALDRVKQDGAVIERLGEPIEPGWYVTGSFQTSGTSGNAAIEFPVRGPQGKGTVTAEATKHRGQWQLDYLAVEIKETGEHIVLVGGESDDAPQPPPI